MFQNSVIKCTFNWLLLKVSFSINIKAKKNSDEDAIKDHGTHWCFYPIKNNFQGQEQKEIKLPKVDADELQNNIKSLCSSSTQAQPIHFF